MVLELIAEIPRWFFEPSPLRLAWMDVVEGWIYLEIEGRCPHCGKVFSSRWILEVDEVGLLEKSRCSCGYPIGREIAHEVTRFLREVESLLRRCRGEDP